jgi:DNA-binding Lrp family transcriptional regulator
MEKAFVCIQCQSGKDKEIVHKLNSIPNVHSHGTLGVYDIVATVESDSIDTMRKIITDQIRKINGITSTITLLQTEEEEPGEELIPDVIPEEKRFEEPPEEEEVEQEEEEDYGNEDYEEKSRKY